MVVEFIKANFYDYELRDVIFKDENVNKMLKEAIYFVLDENTSKFVRNEFLSNKFCEQVKRFCECEVENYDLQIKFEDLCSIVIFERLYQNDQRVFDSIREMQKMAEIDDFVSEYILDYF